MSISPKILNLLNWKSIWCVLMSKTRPGIGIVGLGFMGNNHAKALQTLGNPPKAVCGIRQEDVDKTAPSYKAEAYCDYEKFLSDKNIEGVIVAVRHNLHRDFVIEALEAGKHVLCEKPLSVTSKQAQEMVDTARRSKLHLLTGFNFRFHPAHKILKTMINPNKLKSAWIMDACSYLDPPTYSSKEFGGGCLRTTNIHSLDLVRWLFGEVREVTGTTKILKKGAETEDVAVATLKMESGAVVQTMSSWWHSLIWLMEARVFQEDSVLEGKLGVRDMKSETSSIKEYIGGKAKEIIPKGTGSPPWKEFSQSVLDQAKNFENVIKGTEQAVASGTDGLRAIQIVEAIEKSNEKKTAVSL